MPDLLLCLLGVLRVRLRSGTGLVLENFAWRQQEANLRRTSGRPHLRKVDGALWIVLCRRWSR